MNITRPSDLIDMVLKVNPAARSWSRDPYYVVVVEATRGSFTTSIPGGHKRKFVLEDDTYESYHKGRFEVIGPVSSFSHLLYNQKGINDGKSSDVPSGPDQGKLLE